MNTETLLVKALAFDLVTEAHQKSTLYLQMLQQIAQHLQVTDLNQIMPALQALSAEKKG